MMDKDIDDLSRSAFPDGDVAFDSKYWDQMGAMIDQRKKKRGFIFWWGTGASIVLLIGGLFTINPFEKNESIALAKTQDKKASSLSTEIEYTKEPKNHKKAVLNQIKEEGSIAQNSELDNEPDPTQQIENNDIVKSLDNINPKQNTDDDQPNRLKNSVIIPSGESGSSPEEPLEEDDESPAEAILPPMSNENEESVKTETPKEASNNIINVVEDNNSPLYSMIDPINSGPIPVDFRQYSLYKLPMDTTSLKTTTEFNEEVASNSKLKYFIEPVMGFNSSYKAILVESRNDKSTVSLNYRPTKEMQVGLNLGAKYNNFFGEIGVHFNQIQSLIEVDESRLETETEQHIAERTIIDQIDSVLIKTPVIKVPLGSDFGFQPGDPAYNVDTTFATVYDTTTTDSEVEKTSNTTLKYTLQYLYLPIQVGYEYPVKNFFIGAGVGLDLGFLVNNKGELFDQELNQIVDVTSSDLVNKTTVAYNLQLAFGYYLKPNLSIAIRPNLRQQIISPFKNTNLPSTRLGGFVGLRYDF